MISYQRKIIIATTTGCNSVSPKLGSSITWQRLVGDSDGGSGCHGAHVLLLLLFSGAPINKHWIATPFKQAGITVVRYFIVICSPQKPFLSIFLLLSLSLGTPTEDCQYSVSYVTSEYHKDDRIHCSLSRVSNTLPKKKKKRKYYCD